MTGSRTKTCQNCKTQFTIEPDDFVFYERIKVPPPTFCPECRLQRRMVWRNEHFLFRKKDIFGKEIFSMFPPESEVRILDAHEWMKDTWDQYQSSREYDWNRPFFEQFQSLLKEAPLPSRSVINLVNSEYSNNATDIKNCYLVFGATKVEDSYYSDNLTNSKSCFDSSSMVSSEAAYESFMDQRCHKAFFSSLCEDSHDLYLCLDCVGCSDCFGCVGLRRKQYYFFNQPLSKDEYEKRVAETWNGSLGSLISARRRFEELIREFPRRFAQSYKNVNASGEYISNSRNVTKSYNVNDGENLKYCHFIFNGSSRDSYDHYRFGGNTELIYESGSVGTNCSRVFFCYQCFTNCSDLYYSFSCVSCRDCFGCIGLYKKQYCILNKQYSKEEYEKILPKIIEHMKNMPFRDSQGLAYGFGEFFPQELSPQPYNASIALEFFPLTQDLALKSGFRWHAEDKRDYKTTLNSEQLPDSIKEVPDNIIKEIIRCAHDKNCNQQCAGAFRIVSEELAFYRHYNLPAPRLCPNCRYFERIAQRNPIKLWQRTCMCGGEKSNGGAYSNTSAHFHDKDNCSNIFETSYAPDRPEIVYCEECYQVEVA